jgi:hypothetical protein
MKGMIDFYKYFISKFFENELLLNNLSDYFEYQEVLDGGYMAKRFVNNEETYKSFSVIYGNSNIESFSLSPMNRGVKLNLFELKDYLKKDYSVFNNFREMSTEFIFTISIKHEIRFISYKDIRLKKNVLELHKKGKISEQEIFCEELIFKYKE